MRIVTLANGKSLQAPNFLLSPEEGIYAKAIINAGSPIDWVNYIAYSNSEHNYLFDEDNLIADMQQAGFQDSQLREFGHELDFRAGLKASIYAEATNSSGQTEHPSSTLEIGRAHV